MHLKKKERLFFILTAVVFAAALVFVFAGSRQTAPLVDSHAFTIPVTYEENGETKTESVTYRVDYLPDEGVWLGYYADSGMSDIVTMGEYPDGAWMFVLELNAGYLMGDPQYADVYADGLPSPTITYYDDEWNEYVGVMEAEPFGIRLIGCELPAPIENAFSDSGVQFDHLTVGILTALAFLVLLLGVILVKKDASVVYRQHDYASGIINSLIGFVLAPIFFAVGPEWTFYGFGTQLLEVLSALMAPLTVLGICASIVFRRKGKSAVGMGVQFVGPILFLCLFFLNFLIGFGLYSLFVPAGFAVGAAIALRAKKAQDIVPTKLDIVCIVSNVVLIAAYVFLCIPSLLFGAITSTGPAANTAQKVIAIIAACIIAAAPVYCGIAIGKSIALRKQGKSRAAFAVQFAGFGGIVFSIVVSLLVDLLPWISISIN